MRSWRWSSKDGYAHSELAFIFTEMSNWKTYLSKSMMSIKMSGSLTPLGGVF